MNKCCIKIPEILLPNTEDMCAWAVIACDQHTSDEKYWAQLEEYVGKKPSSLRLILPELYLDGDYSARTKSIFETMRAYRKNGVFKKLPAGFILVERSTPFSETRYGIVLAVDLECYSYERGNTAAIRASEATIVERIPPRLKIREDACVELPHIMLLYNDVNDHVLQPLKSGKEKLPLLYDFELNMGGGHVKGYFIENSEEIAANLMSLQTDDGLVFVVGDGNHSLATAKAHWDKIKNSLSEEDKQCHPARFALCEAVNVYDKGIRFEPIHRIVKGIDVEAFVRGFPSKGKGQGSLYVSGKKQPVDIDFDIARAISVTDEYITNFIVAHGGKVDYIHGEEALKELTENHADFVGIALPKMDKKTLFPQVVKYGNFPRKTFSMGESAEKRYYIEAKEITRDL